MRRLAGLVRRRRHELYLDEHPPASPLYCRAARTTGTNATDDRCGPILQTNAADERWG
ncbi:MAG: hypothetical protein ACUVQK_04705 [Thermogutta sp.]